MSRAGWSLSGPLLAVTLGVTCGCSRPSAAEGSGAAASTASTRVSPPLAGSAPAPETASASPGTIPVPTPEDAEDAAAHRITEQNLESQLDRLEREIQAE